MVIDTIQVIGVLADKVVITMLGILQLPNRNRLSSHQIFGPRDHRRLLESAKPVLVKILLPKIVG
jgi:hypothetical protein